MFNKNYQFFPFLSQFHFYFWDMKILIIEDELELQNSIKQFLVKEKYLVESANDFEKAIEKIAIYDYDCILLDIMLPNGSGFDILKHIKSLNKNCNIIILSAKNSIDDKVLGLELGADDYLSKPFHLSELNARIKALLRRKVFDKNNINEWKCVSLDIENRTCKVNQIEINFNRKEFDIINYMLLNKNRLVTKTALAEHVWGDMIDQSDNFDFIYYQIKNIRKKLIAANADIDFEAIYGIGYKLVEK